MIDYVAVQDILKKIKEKMQKEGYEISDDMLTQVHEKAGSVFNLIEALDADQVKTYNEFKSLKLEIDKDLKVAKEIKDKLEKKFARMKNLENFFTSSIELKHDLSNKTWRVNENTCMVEVFDQDKALEEIKEMTNFSGDIIPPNMFD
jgi:BMFP domain-containing protein YqiC